MHSTPKKIHQQIALERPPCERADVFHDHVCKGKSTHEHVWKYAGRQVDEAWAIIKLCEYAHSVGPFGLTGILDKRKNEYLSLLHATDEDLKKYPRFDWQTRRAYLKKLYENETPLPAPIPLVQDARHAPGAPHLERVGAVPAQGQLFA
jgi:hypothetical protein